MATNEYRVIIIDQDNEEKIIDHVFYQYFSNEYIKLYNNNYAAYTYCMEHVINISEIKSITFEPIQEVRD